MGNFDIKVLHVTETIKGGVVTYLNEIYESQKEFLGEKNLFFTTPSDSIDDLSFFVSEDFQFNSKDKEVLDIFLDIINLFQKLLIELTQILSMFTALSPDFSLGCIKY